ncbi:MAG: aminotransferase class IV [Weeksellaceae bacterium]
MCQFLESIKLQDGILYHLDWHQKRVDETFRENFKLSKALNLKDILQNQEIPVAGLFKVRITYSSTDYKVEISSYQARKIESFSLVETDYKYPFKSTKRAFLNKALAHATTDEVIFCKDGYLTDSTYANVVLYDGESWFTPQTFLLNGTTRQRLLSENKIKETSIHRDDLHQFQKIGFINALNDLGAQIINLNAL